MIKKIYIENFIFIDKIEIPIHTNLNIISGDSGTGKSVILHAINFFFSKKIREFMRYQNGANTVIAIEFDSNQIKEYINDKEFLEIINDNENKGQDIILITKNIKPNNKSEIIINNKVFSQNLIEKIYQESIIICSQKHQSYFLDLQNHLNILDIFGVITNDAEILNTLWSEIKQMKKEIVSMQFEIADDVKNRLFLEKMINDIETLDTFDSEEADIVAKKRSLQEFSQGHSYLSKGMSMLSIGEQSALNILNQARKQLVKVGSSIESVISIIDSCTLELHEAIKIIEENIYGKETFESELQKLDERLELLRDTAARYNILNAHQLPQLLEQAKNKIKKIIHNENIISDLEKKIEFLESEYYKFSYIVSQKRSDAALHFINAVNFEMQSLRMQNMNFYIEHHNDRIIGAERGIDNIEFIFTRTQNGEMVKTSINEISGGELSRIVLTIYSVIAKNNKQNIMIFDEIDTGVSGQIANCIGRVLHSLSKSKQLIIITHLAQIACFADQHINIFGINNPYSYTIGMRILDQREHVEEIARMLAGQTVTEAAIKAANQLIDDNKLLK